MTKVVEVAAAVLLRETEGGVEYLLAQRPVGKVYAGYWEFPGGKVEPGESLRQALVRELQEELGVTVDRAWPWLSCEFTYPHARVRLKFFRVTSWHGAIAPIEHSGFVWTRIGQPTSVSPVLPANGPILRALALPSMYVCIDAGLARLEQSLADGMRLFRLGGGALPSRERRRLAEGAVRLIERHEEACVLVDDDEDLARQVGARGLHLSPDRLMQLAERPPFEWVAASCRDADDLAQAASLGLDFAVLESLRDDAEPAQDGNTGWNEFARLIERSALPVFASGGISREMLETARQCGAHGIALFMA